MQIITLNEKLRGRQRKLLLVDLQICYKGQPYPYPVPFVVDTASEQTYLTPTWEGLLKKRCLFKLTPEYRTVTTMFGELSLKFSRELTLQAMCHDRNYVQLSGPEEGVGFGRLCGWRFWRHYEPTDNILGCDVLRKWSLYHDPQHGIHILLTDHALPVALRKDAGFNSYLAGRPRPLTVKLDDLRRLNLQQRKP